MQIGTKTLLKFISEIITNMIVKFSDDFSHCRDSLNCINQIFDRSPPCEN